MSMSVVLDNAEREREHIICINYLLHVATVISIHAFCRRISILITTIPPTQVADYLIDPLCRGVFASSPKSLSLRSCFPLFDQYEMKYGSLIMGLLRDKEGKCTCVCMYIMSDGHFHHHQWVMVIMWRYMYLIPACT